jgi:mono/diheme cytochrome c family protein
MTKPILPLAFVVAVMISSFCLDTAAEGKAGDKYLDVSERSAAQLYSKYCASCHGKDGSSKTFKAKFNHARNLTDPDWQKSVSDERIFNSINNGRGKMPSFSKKMTESEIDSLVTYVRSLKK